jgi:hypothetical protein
LAAQDVVQLPGQVVGVGDGRVQAESAGWRMTVRGVAYEQDASFTVAGGDEGLDGPGAYPVDGDLAVWVTDGPAQAIYDVRLIGALARAQ